MSVVTPRCAAFTAAVKIRIPSAIFDGIFSCRHIIPHGGGSSNQWSEHSWGNAVDFTGSAATQARVVAFAEANKGRFAINNIIPPGSAVNAVHVDFLPSHAGQVPACAGGPPVKSPGARSGNIKNPFGSNPTGTGHASGSTTTHIGPQVGTWIATVGRWAEVGGGGLVMAAGLGVILFGVTGSPAPGVAGTLGKMAASRAPRATRDPVGSQRSTESTAGARRTQIKAQAARKPVARRRSSPRVTKHETIDTKTPAGKARARKLIAENR